MADRFRKEVEERIEDDLLSVPGTRRASDLARVEAQQPLRDDLRDGFGLTAIAGASRVIADEAPSLIEQTFNSSTPISDAFSDGGILEAAQTAATVAGVGALTLFGFRSGEADYDKEERYSELTEGIPFEFHDEILDHDNYEAAVRSRTRVLEDIERGRRISQQDSGQLAALAGSLFDVDAPLMFFSGGAYGSAKVARTTLRMSRLARLSPNAALRVSGSAQGLNAGLQAGAVVGAVDAHTRETAGWQDVANMALQSMLLGGGIGGAVKGDVRTSVQQAQQEFHERIALDDPAFREDVDVGNMQGDNISDFLPQGGETGVGAAQAGRDGRMTNPELVNPAGSITPTNQSWIDAARTWRHESGWGDRKAQDDDTWWAAVASSTGMNLTTNNFNRLYKSESAVANYIAGNIFESASGLGRGRATAATRMEYYHRRIQQHLGENVVSIQQEWARKNNATWQGSGYHITQDGLGVFNREVMLELNDRRLGRVSTRNPEIKRAADQYEIAGAEALGIGKGKDGETAVDGFETIPESRGYTPYKWSGSRILDLEDRGIVNRDDIISALSQSYRAAGMGALKDAEAVAKAVVHRALSKETELDTSVLSMLTGDGKDFLRESMVMAGMREGDADKVLERLIGSQHDRAKEGFAKMRNDVDMDTRIPTRDGSELRIVDLMDNDLHGIWQRYTRQMSGAAALARHGITNKAKRREIIDAMRVEQRSLGEEPIDAGLLEAMLSHFNAGPVHGYGLGRNAGTNEGIGHAALLKRAVNLSLLEKLGVTQMAETGVTIAQNGLANWMTRGPMALFNRELKAGNKQLLDDMAFLTGEIGNDHWQFAPWLDLDDATAREKGDWLYAANKWTSAGSFLQGYTSAFNHVRSFQQKTAALGVSDKIFREVRARHVEGHYTLTDEVQRRFENDLGLMPEDITALFDLVDNGTIEFTTRGNSTFVNRLNADQWTGPISETFASSVTRNVNQLVQKSMAGEQDAWMHTHVGSIFMHLKTFPLQAIQKQAMRNAKFIDKQAFATVLYGLATAAVAVRIRDALDGRERSPEDLAKQAFNYSNMTGFIPMFYDPMMTLIGMDDARINQFGPVHDWTPPTIRIANQMTRIPGALANTVTGESDWHDRQALKAIPFAGTYFLSRIFD